MTQLLNCEATTFANDPRIANQGSETVKRMRIAVGKGASGYSKWWSAKGREAERSANVRSSRSILQQDQRGKSGLVALPRSLEIGDCLFAGINVETHARFRETRSRIVIGDVSFALHHDEHVGEIDYLLRKSLHDLAVRAGGFCGAVIERTIDLTPRGVAAQGTAPSYQKVGAARRERMEDTVIGCTDSPSQRYL